MNSLEGFLIYMGIGAVSIAAIVAVIGSIALAWRHWSWVVCIILSMLVAAGIGKIVLSTIVLSTILS